MNIGDLFHYSDNCRRLLRQTLLDNPGTWDQPLSQPLIEFKSIREIVVHAAGAEERWVKMRIGGREVPFYASRAPATIDGVFTDWDNFRSETYTFLEGQTLESLQKIYRITLGDNLWTGDLTVEQMLFHVLNHETHHRGQVSMALQQMDVDPPDFDFIFLHR
jgi:uncharacterized damage-inducible protein DinB